MAGKIGGRRRPDHWAPQTQKSGLDRTASPTHMPGQCGLLRMDAPTYPQARSSTPILSVVTEETTAIKTIKKADINDRFTSTHTRQKGTRNARHGHNYIGHNYIGHDSIGHNYIGHNYIGHNYIGHNYIGHNYTGHNDIGHNYIGQKGTRNARHGTARHGTARHGMMGWLFCDVALLCLDADLDGVGP